MEQTNPNPNKPNKAIWSLGFVAAKTGMSPELINAIRANNTAFSTRITAMLYALKWAKACFKDMSQ